MELETRLSFQTFLNINDFISGPSQLFKWNPASALFQLVSSLPTRDAVDAAVHRKFDHIILFISNSNSSLSSWFLTQSGVTPYSEGDDNPSAVHTFSIDDVHYLAVATRVEKSSSSGYVNIYEITRGNITKVQSIATKAASSITTFKVNDNEYLVIANDRAYSDYGLSTYYLTVDVYSFSKGIFEWFDSIPSYRAFRVATFQVGSFTYLAIVHYDEYVSFYQFGIEFGFQKADKLDLHGIRDLSFINKDGNIYVFLGASSTHHSPSKLLELYSSGKLFCILVSRWLTSLLLLGLNLYSTHSKRNRCLVLILRFPVRLILAHSLYPDICW